VEKGWRWVHALRCLLMDRKYWCASLLFLIFGLYGSWRGGFVACWLAICVFSASGKYLLEAYEALLVDGWMNVFGGQPIYSRANLLPA